MKLKTSAQHTLVSVPLLAHAGHFENKEQTETNPSSNQTESNPSSKEQQSQKDHQSQPDTASTQESSSDHSQTSHSDINNQTTTQVVEEQSTTQAQILTIGKIQPLGETILGLIITTPFFLYALRKRIHQ